MKKQSKPWNLRVPQELYDRMKAYDEVQWSAVVRNMLENRLNEMDKHRRMQ